ncbi:MAG TPA: 23S rRNA (guanosine(2251)-2'-O)-methyltransferase RlmB [Streptosporangiaceae bacterium]|nr:23S rRNA (guanosine(2251)-2'-O)-methyltransferase RlmB [Streptosporangiaceae bacterium]
MSGKSGGAGKSMKPARGGVTKSGRPRPGTGGYGRRKLEGRGPTPPAELRTGHPAQRRAAAAAAPVPRSASGASSRRSRSAAAGSATAPRTGTARGSGTAAEIVAGRNAVLEALQAAVPATVLHVGPRLDADERINEAIKLAADSGIPVAEAGRAELDRISGGAIHQGLALRIKRYSYAHPDDLITPRRTGRRTAPLIVALDGVTDPRNLGAIARSVAAFGGDGVLVPARRSAGVTAGAWKASAGALARVPVAQVPNLTSALANYARAGLFVAGLDAGADDEVGALALADSPLVLVIGSEGKGLSRLVAQQCDALVKIPISGAESLNASVAAGIALYQVAALRSRLAGADS